MLLLIDAARPAHGDIVIDGSLRDRRFDDSERLEILHAWLGEAEAATVAPQIESAIRELENRRPVPSDHAAE